MGVHDGWRQCLLAGLVLTAVARAGAAQTAPQVVVTGVVLDQTGAVLPGASVELVNGGGAVVQTSSTDGVGAFRFERVAAGQYDLRATFEGFKPASTRLRVGARSPGAQKLVLALANVTQDVTVSTGGDQVDTSATKNVDAIVVDPDVLDSLPILDQDYLATIARFLDAGAIGAGGPTIVVNGMEVSAARVSASAVQQIKVNQDPYSAEYARPGRGRIEILTKPGGQSYEGEGNLILRNARFDAQNAFATTKPPERKRIVEGMFGGPLGGGGKTSFTLSGNDNLDDQTAEVFAIGLAGPIQGLAPQENREALLSLSVNHQWSDRNTIAIRPSYQYQMNENRGVGGTTLASAGTTFTHHEQQVTYTQQTTLRPSLLNQFQILLGHEREPTLSASSERGIVVAGAFTSGGQGDLVLTEVHTQLTESLVWLKGAHQVQTGFQLPDWSRRGFDDRTNFNGTYYFSNLTAYEIGRPYSFLQQQGNGDITFLEKQVGAYIKDDWQLRSGLTASFGVRYDWQNYFHDSNNFAPRGSIAWAPGKSKTNVIRGGIGIFNDRSGAAAIADLLQYRPGGLIRYVITNPDYPEPFPSGTPPLQPRSSVQLAPDIQIPQSLQYSLGVDHQLRKALTLSVTYTGARGYHLFRSRDLNAPLPPLYLVRPDLTRGVVREIESDGRQSTESLQVTVRGRMGRWFNGQAQYTFSRAFNDTNGITSYPANDWDLTGEWGRADFDRPHRFLLLGGFSAGKLVDVGVSLATNSAGPYSETLGADVYNNGRGRARPPGVGRNTLDAAAFTQLDLRLSKNLGKNAGKDGRKMAVALDIFNVLNQVNYGSFVGTRGSPLFGQPVSARTPRQLQLSARVSF